MKKQLNLNPKSIEKYNKKDIGKLLIAVYLILMILLFINAGVIYYNNKSLEKNNELVKSEIKNYKEAGSNYNNISNDIKNKEVFINKMKKIDKDVSAWEYLENLKKYFPSNVFLEDITFKKDGITMIGTANSEDEVTVFLANLQMSKLYKDSRVISIEDVEIADNNSGIIDESNKNNSKDKDKKEEVKKPKVEKKVKFTISTEGVKTYEEK
ncbi:PilN domain-containing protein [Clostridium sp. Ade.TY]|uniref:PilN domain-containing protein n=1 Tax=Clostridium sp. Ade.TY TaxID=1391647 RepID=UPI000406DBB5|nr:PilN domain-containing protein [Clostridium sp. Ade.TY]